MKCRIFNVIEEVLLKFKASSNDKSLQTFRTVFTFGVKIFFLLHGPNDENTVNFRNTKIYSPIDIA
jgi:hypothetical protein